MRELIFILLDLIFLGLIIYCLKISFTREKNMICHGLQVQKRGCGIFNLKL